jgi:hypothetical protein
LVEGRRKRAANTTRDEHRDTSTPVSLKLISTPWGQLPLTCKGALSYFGNDILIK